MKLSKTEYCNSFKIEKYFQKIQAEESKDLYMSFLIQTGLPQRNLT